MRESQTPSNRRTKTIVITGGNTGIGLATAKQLAERGGRVILACRDQQKAAAARQSILQLAPSAEVQLYPLDLASLESVRQFAAQVMQANPVIDVLINNAGAYPTKQCYTQEGFEFQFGVNYLGHFLLTHLLMPSLMAAGEARIINLSSLMHILGKIDYDSFKGRAHYVAARAYGQSKLANAMFSRELAQRLPAGITSNALHPGGVDSDIYRDLPGWVHNIMKRFLISPDRAGIFIADMALAEGWKGRSGEFKSAQGPLPILRAVKDDAQCRRLYEESCILTNVNPL